MERYACENYAYLRCHTGYGWPNLQYQDSQTSDDPSLDRDAFLSLDVLQHIIHLRDQTKHMYLQKSARISGLIP